MLNFFESVFPSSLSPNWNPKMVSDDKKKNFKFKDPYLVWKSPKYTLGTLIPKLKENKYIKRWFSL